jgi:hypothetical protein
MIKDQFVIAEHHAGDGQVAAGVGRGLAVPGHSIGGP